MLRHALFVARKDLRFLLRARETILWVFVMPLVFFYFFGILMTAAGLALGLLELALRIAGNAITPASIVLVAVLLIAGLQLTLFAMWFDMEANKDLR